VRGVAPGWFHAPPRQRPSGTNSVVGLALVLGLLVVGTALVTSGGGILEQGGRLVMAPDASPSPEVAVAGGPSATARPTPPVTTSSDPLAPETSPEAASAFSCEDSEIRDATRSRWELRSVLAGARRGFDRVTLQLARRGDASRGGSISVEWMRPEEARDAFGIPRFDGRKGLMFTFPAQVTTSGAQLIGPTDLKGDRIDSISGVYRFIDVEGRPRVFIAIRDRSCARIRATELGDQGGASRRANIIVDLAIP
jgi:hypothetical protein